MDISYESNICTNTEWTSMFNISTSEYKCKYVIGCILYIIRYSKFIKYLHVHVIVVSSIGLTPGRIACYMGNLYYIIM